LTATFIDVSLSQNQKGDVMKHGLSKDPLYFVWQDMRKRCGVTRGNNKGHKQIYIKRGIGVCKEWLVFLPFYKWAKDKWEKGLQIDRIDNSGDYTPENCRFVTRKTNGQNTRASKRWYIGGVKYNSKRDAAKTLGVSPQTVKEWCQGRQYDNYYRQPKPGCYAENLYQNTILG